MWFLEQPNAKAKKGDFHQSIATTAQQRRKKLFCLTLSSNVWYLIGSVFYMWLAVIDLQWEKVSIDIPEWVLAVDDDYSWAPYPVGDDYVFQAGSSWVSQEQIVYAIAALSFVITGFIYMFAQPGVLGIFFILAGAFGLASAFLLEEDEHLSNVFNAVSVHLFVLEAIGLLTRRAFFGGLKHYIRLADIFFLVATCVDVALSYTILFDAYNVRLSRLACGSAALWLTSALIYICCTLYSWTHGGFDDDAAGAGPLAAQLEKTIALSDKKGGTTPRTYNTDNIMEEEEPVWDSKTSDLYETETQVLGDLSPEKTTDLTTDYSSQSRDEYMA